MTDTAAARPPIAELMTDDALIVDIQRVRSQLQYARLLDAAGRTLAPTSDQHIGHEHLIDTWEALTAEAAHRGLQA